MFCPNCRSEYRPGFYRCSDCDIALVEQLPPDRSHSDTDVIKIFETQDRALGSIVETILRAKEIPFLTKFGHPDVYTFGFAGTEIWVAERNAKAALDAIESIPGDAPAASERPRPGRSIRVTRYSRRTGQPKDEDIKDPSWSIVEREIHTMDPFEKPIVFLMTSDDNTETECMAITGGGDFYHLQISDSDGRWEEAVNPGRGGREIEVWTSDQGFTTEERNTWAVEDALRIARFFWDEQKPSPDVKWS